MCCRWAKIQTRTSPWEAHTAAAGAAAAGAGAAASAVAAAVAGAVAARASTAEAGAATAAGGGKAEVGAAGVLELRVGAEVDGEGATTEAEAEGGPVGLVAAEDREAGDRDVALRVRAWADCQRRSYSVYAAVRIGCLQATCNALHKLLRSSRCA